MGRDKVVGEERTQHGCLIAHHCWGSQAHPQPASVNHVVLFMDVERATEWSDQEVAARWLTLCPPRMAINDNPEAPEQAKCFATFVAELATDEEKIAVYRQRLSDLSWLIRFLNEYIVRKANREDQIKGRFWDRFYAPAKPPYITSM